ncbi:hypothetical protein GCM10011614_27630 [Novosphingobium colocasiae]|uniref:Uncharacterized protein n=1 Tax=Novosphingobium colocasiae TaxID=1256513 RepID=A0A918PII4_9SPHN|nr:hypothetical protein GCM10011614_27630 [Novosphingobium colocasiae]
MLKLRAAKYTPGGELEGVQSKLAEAARDVDQRLLESNNPVFLKMDHDPRSFTLIAASKDQGEVSAFKLEDMLCRAIKFDTRTGSHQAQGRGTHLHEGNPTFASGDSAQPFRALFCVSEPVQQFGGDQRWQQGDGGKRGAKFAIEEGEGVWSETKATILFSRRQGGPAKILYRPPQGFAQVFTVDVAEHHIVGTFALEDFSNAVPQHRQFILVHIGS